MTVSSRTLKGINEPTLSVSEINAKVRSIVEGNFPFVLIAGEVSGFTNYARSKHWYFQLKDAQSVLPCVMFVSKNAAVNFQMSDGVQVLIRAKLSIYTPSGKFQAIVDHMELRGEGALRLAFERLKTSLHEKGWFDATRKKSLPVFPTQIVVVSAKSGAAVKDVFVNIWRRYPHAHLKLIPTSVQGQFAIQEIVEAIKQANQTRPIPDFAIVTRGGGSLEDLEAFNSEEVAKAIYESEIPIVSAVGHEVDYTIADFVADVRAATPSTAAEITTPDGKALRASLEQYEVQFRRQMSAMITRTATRLTTTSERLRDPRQTLRPHAHKLVDMEERLHRSELNDISLTRSELTQLIERLHLVAPEALLLRYGATIQRDSMRLRLRIQSEMTKTQLEFNHEVKDLLKQDPKIHIRGLFEKVERVERRLCQLFSEVARKLNADLAKFTTNLDAVSPLGVLKRGYAVVSTPDETRYGKVVRNIQSLNVGDVLHARIADGVAITKVTKTRKEPSIASELSDHDS